jgi:hypothetical protein
MNNAFDMRGDVMTRLAKFVAAAVRQVRSSIALQWTRQASSDVAAGAMTPLAQPSVLTRQPAARPDGFPEVAEGAD